jgi:hypothetical protein
VKHRVATIVFGTILALASAAVVSANPPTGTTNHGAEVSAIAHAVQALSGKSHGEAVSAIAKKHGAEVSAAAKAKGAAASAAGKAKAAANKAAAKAKGAAAAEPGRLKAAAPAS